MTVHKSMIVLVLVAACLGGCDTGSDAANPIGPAKDQCWKFVFKREEFRGAPNFDCFISATREGCVELASCTIDDGVATYAVCCKKDASGNCRNCKTVVGLTVTRDDVPGGGRVTFDPKPVFVKCVKPEREED